MSKLTLVSKDALYGALPYPDDAIEAEFYGKVLDAIDNLPIAYDPDKVVEQLTQESRKTLNVSEAQFDMDYGEYSSYCSLSLYDAIEIVKKGGQE